MKPLVIYHAQCTDGFGAAYAAWKKLGDDVEYVPMHYNQKLDLDTCAGRDVYVLDFSFNKETTLALIEISKFFVWLDHHKTSFEMWCLDGERNRFEHHDMGNDYILLDNNKSGALLAWEYFHPDVDAPTVIKHIDDRDRWQFAMAHSKAIHAALQIERPWSFTGFRLLCAPTSYDEMVLNGEGILRYTSQQVDDIVAGATNVCIVSPALHHGLAVNSSLHQSEVGHALANKSGTFGLIWYYNPVNKQAACSLRSIGDYDVSAIAKLFGGGGHRNAAGFSVPMNKILNWIGA